MRLPARLAGDALRVLGCVLGAVLLAAPAALAQAPQLVKDICDSATLGSDPQLGRALDGRLVFLATGGAVPGVWRSDGTRQGTLPVREVGCFRFWDLGIAGDTWHFAAYCDIRELQLWRTDGTWEGTRRYATIPLTEGGAGLLAGLVLDGVDYILVDLWPQVQLWRADAESETAAPVAVVSHDSPPAGTAFIVEAGGRLFFPGGDPDHGIELWSSDGTAAGTGMVRDIFPGPGRSDLFAVAGASLAGSVYFSARNPATGCQLWTSNGTAAGTREVTDLSAGRECAEPPRVLAAHRGAILFRGSDGPGRAGLWRTDGTAAGTVFLAPGLPDRVIGPVGDLVLYSSSSGIYRTDGTADGTRLIGTLGSAGQVTGAGVAASGRVLFPAYEYAGSGTELWVSDGTDAGTRMVLDIVPGSGQSEPRPMAAIGTTAYFSALDLEHGRELWRSEGTAESTWMVADVNPSTGHAVPMGLTSAGGLVFFWADRCQSQMSLWRTAGRPDTTVRLRDLWPTSLAQPPWDWFRAAPGGVYFAAGDLEHGSELWWSDGTPEGTRMVEDLLPGSAGSNPQWLAMLGGRLYFSASDGVRGTELWSTDGTAGGTALVADLRAGAASSTPENLTSTGAAIVFVADDGGGKALWRSDGSPGGTVRVVGPESGFFLDSGVYNRFAALGELVLFAASDGVHGQELWRTDGTSAGTCMVKDISPSTDDLNAAGVTMGLTAVGGRVVFAAADIAGDVEPWSSDGTEEGTFRIRDINPGREGSNPAAASRFFETWEGRFCFTAWEPEAGREPWCSDGTEAGTQRLADLLDYPYDTLLWDLVVAGRTLVLGLNPQHVYCDRCREKAQLWLSDGTAAGTRRVLTPIPTDFRAMPFPMVSHEGCAFFPGFDDRHGWELWRLCPDATRAPRSRVAAAR